MPQIIMNRSLHLDNKKNMSSSDMDSSMESTIRLNNESSSLLCSGEDAKAVERLSRSLTSMRRMVAMKCRIDSSGASTSSSCNTTSSEDRPALPSSLQVAALRDSDYFIYSRCMEVPSFHHRNSKHLPIYSACIVLNLALAHHGLGIKGRRSSLSKAERMYYMALQLISAGPYIPPKDETVLSMRIFAVNNLVQVHQEQCQYKKAKAAVKHLSNLLNGVSLFGGTFFHKEELRKFVVNASLWEPPKIAASA
jgi:hypothetical protein